MGIVILRPREPCLHGERNEGPAVLVKLFGRIKLNGTSVLLQAEVFLLALSQQRFQISQTFLIVILWPREPCLHGERNEGPAVLDEPVGPQLS
jgi:hypothetical protein